MKLVKYNIFINILIYAFVKINRIHTYLQVRKYIIIQDLIPYTSKDIILVLH